jgi:hypothetical protein
MWVSTAALRARWTSIFVTTSPSSFLIAYASYEGSEIEGGPARRRSGRFAGLVGQSPHPPTVNCLPLDLVWVDPAAGPRAERLHRRAGGITIGSGAAPKPHSRLSVS